MQVVPVTVALLTQKNITHKCNPPPPPAPRMHPDNRDSFCLLEPRTDEKDPAWQLNEGGCAAILRTRGSAASVKSRT